MKIPAYLKQLEQRHAAGKATEHSHRPALQALLESALPGVMATNEPKRTACGAPDFVLTRNEIPIGYVEAKDVGKDLDDPAWKEQLNRYTESLDNLIFTNYTEFRLFRDGKQVPAVTIAEIGRGRITPKAGNFAALSDLLNTFAGYQGLTITSADDLALRMALKARMLAAQITGALAQDEKALAKAPDWSGGDGKSELLKELGSFRKHLIHDIKPADFADIYAQTVAYGMFAARLHDPSPETFTRKEAAELIPANNPFLRKFFQHIAGFDLDDRIRWIVDALADIFRAADVGELMRGYGKATRREDPFLHFYETFLGKYDPKLRKSRGVYYTPEPVVNFIVRAVDDILRAEFDFTQGLADTRKTTIEINHRPSTDKGGKGVADKRKKKEHKVQILDPATGTGTFLAAIVRRIYETEFTTQKGIWPQYVKNHLIPRLNGFEVLMASYAMAHTKLEMVLRESGCQLDQTRLRVFLTNSLEEHHPDTDTVFARWLSEEANEANAIKRDAPVMVVIGNPPYSGISSNMGEWINKLIEEYKYVDGEHFKERKHWLHDDYVKFIRYGQYYIDRTAEGVLAYVNNHSFLDNPTFRGMRWSLLQSFDKIYILDLHGNAKKKETAPDGSADKNVFDIQQGVSINLFVKTGNKKKGALGRVFHHDLYGLREKKYNFLWENSFDQVGFAELKPMKPYYFFVPKNWKSKEEYDNGFQISELFSNKSTGIVTMGDSFILGNSENEIMRIVQDFLKSNYSDQELKDKYSLGKNYAKWINQNKAGIDFKGSEVVRILYRPFDSKRTVYNRHLIWRWRNNTMKHFLVGENIGLTVGRQGQVAGNIPWCLVFITKNITDFNLYYRGGNVVMPLYRYPDEKQQTLDDQPNREPNLNPEIVKTIATGLGLRFTPEKQDDPQTFAPIDLLDYIYAVLHSPAWRDRYKEFLKIDFPRVPYPTDQKQFRKLAELGGQLRALHLLESPTLNTLITGYPITGNHVVSKPTFQPTDRKNHLGKVHINQTQYFENVPQTAWNFHIGGYQPAQKWLKDRTGRPLSPDDVTHYQKIIRALTETERLMGEIDKCGGFWPNSL